MRLKITAGDNSPVLLLTPNILTRMGLQIGDEVEISLIDRTLIIHPTDDSQRAAHIQAAVEDVLARRHQAFKRLAES